jgi:hypothetical protein
MQVALLVNLMMPALWDLGGIPVASSLAITKTEWNRLYPKGAQAAGSVDSTGSGM